MSNSLTYTPLPLADLAASELRDDNPDSNPCLHCGACCSHYRVSFYFGELDGGNGGWVPAELTTPVTPHRVCMKGTEHAPVRCVALQGTVGEPGISCAIYTQRPSPCRDFSLWEADGSPNPDCQRLRLALGLAPLRGRPEADNDPDGPGHPNHPPQPAAA
ncbi:YkgJ family cysteine cluster protein [Kerstersia similis]|uniref:YkgJ family cysteine cluster protein n=1 Tax=Kerstersia similis TaxID=206505 RepID=UPI0039EE163C